MITMDLVADQSVVIVVDTYLPGGGAYNLNITLQADSPCPCGDMPFWSDALEQTPTSCTYGDEYVEVRINNTDSPINGAFLYTNGYGPNCAYSVLGTATAGDMTISAEQSDACQAQLTEWIDANSLVCSVY
jgi:hypothetical protein